MEPNWDVNQEEIITGLTSRRDQKYLHFWLKGIHYEIPSRS